MNPEQRKDQTEDVGHRVFSNPLLIDDVLATRSGVEIRLRRVSKPEVPPAILLQKLKMKPPERLDMQLKDAVNTS